MHLFFKNLELVFFQKKNHKKPLKLAPWQRLFPAHCASDYYIIVT